jgi:hypothetical protein
MRILSKATAAKEIRMLKLALFSKRLKSIVDKSN